MIYCQRCSERMTLDHDFDHGQPVHVDNDSRWCTVPEGEFHAPDFGRPMELQF